MLFYFYPFFLSFLFLLGMEIVVFFPVLVFPVAVFLFFVAVLGGRSLGRKWIFSLLPLFFTISSLALLYLVTMNAEKQIFVALAFILYYLNLLGVFRLRRYSKDQTAKAMIMATSSAAVFFTYASMYGFYLNFFVPLIYLMLVYLFVTLLVSFQYFSIILESNKKKAWIYSFVLALVMTEISWTINFWPFGYLTSGVSALVFYYVLWEIARGHLLNKMSRKKIVFNLILFSVIIILVLATSRWLPSV